MYHHEHNDDDKFILMWFIDIVDEVHDLACEQNDSDKKVYLLYVMILVNHF